MNVTLLVTTQVAAAVPLVAVIVAVPGATAFTSPEGETLAMEESLLDHVTVAVGEIVYSWSGPPPTTSQALDALMSGWGGLSVREPAVVDCPAVTVTLSLLALYPSSFATKMYVPGATPLKV